MRIILTGATGCIGSAVLEALIRSGHQVTALVRNAERAALVSARGARPLTVDLAEPRGALNAMRNFEAYVHAAFEASPRGPSVDRTAIEVLIEAARDSDQAVLVYTSGVWILGNTREPATEETPVNPVPMVAWRPDHERAVLAAQSQRLRTVVIRPGIVYGGPRGIVGDMLRSAENGLIRVIGNGENRWSLVYHRDLADLFVRAASNPEASGVYHATDEGDERVNDLVEAIATHAPSRPEVRHVPLAEAHSKLGAYADALALDQVVRSPRAHQLGWSPTLRSVAGNVPRLFEEWRRERDAE